ncbi:MAG TPA: RidA family protein [Candidatus Phocaeicola gallistercoris]|nr:RidA family protein [Candidatus Phocaeicola gallistercoris]
MKKVIFTEKAPAAIGPYSQAIEVNGIVFVSGQLPVNPQTGEIVAGDVADQTAQSFENIKNILSEVGLSTANIVKTTVFLSDMSLFADMNKIYSNYFTEAFPARSAVAVKALPKGALVEIECIAVKE